MYEEEIWPLVQPLDNRLSSKCTLKNLRLMLQAKPEEFQQLWDSFPSSYDRYPGWLILFICKFVDLICGGPLFVKKTFTSPRI